MADFDGDNGPKSFWEIFFEAAKKLDKILLDNLAGLEAEQPQQPQPPKPVRKAKSKKGGFQL